MTVAAPPADHVRALRSRLTGTALAPGDAGYDEARVAFNLMVQQTPPLIAFPADADDVCQVVRFARERGFRVAPQRTGHNAGPIESLEHTILLRTDKLGGVQVDAAARRARVGGGAQWQDVVPVAAESGLSALHGSAADIGIAGYSLGGGVGWQARKHGLQANSVTAVELVTAAGELVRADRDNEPELFWALRGGGGNFGVVTALEFDLYPQETVFAGMMFFALEQAPEVFHTWRELLAGAPDELTSTCRILRFPDIPELPDVVRGQNLVVMNGAYLGSEAEGRDLLAPLAELGPGMDTWGQVPTAALTELHMDPPDPVPVLTDHMLVDLSAEAFDRLMAATGPGVDTPLGMVELRHTGGALGRSEPEHGALDHLPGSYLAFAGGMVVDAESAAAVGGALEGWRASLAPYRAGEYLNFVERPTDVAAAFGEGRYERLARVKAALDPDEVFRANHQIRPARG